jgi:hypothetical protein
MIPTPKTLRRVNRRLNRERNEAERALRAMRRGAALYHCGPGHWSLSTGERISEVAARMITFDRNVAGVGDALFDRELSQTFRHISQEETDHE